MTVSEQQAAVPFRNRRPGQLDPFLVVMFSVGLVIIANVPILIAAVIDFREAGLLVLLPLAVICLIALFLGTRNQLAALTILIIVLPWQPLLSIPFAGVLGGSGVKLVVATKELYATTLLAILILRQGKRIRWQFVDIAALAFLLVYLFYFAVSSAGLVARVVSLREGVMIVTFYLLGRVICFDVDRLRRLIAIIVLLSALVALFGYVEYFLFGEMTWERLGIFNYFEAKWGDGAIQIRNENHIPHNWYTYIDTFRFRRMVGPIGDATSLSRFLSLSVAALIFSPRLFGQGNRGWAMRVLLLGASGGALILSFGRGGMIIVAIAVMLRLWYRSRPLAVLFGLPALSLLIVSQSFLDLLSGSPLRHIERMLIGVGAIRTAPWGYGLGSAGQLAALFSQNVLDLNVQESYLGSLAFQMGIVGLLSYFLFVAALLWSLFRTLRHARRLQKAWEPGMALLCISTLSGIFLTSFLANSAISPISAGLSILLCGAVVTLRVQMVQST